MENMVRSCKSITSGSLRVKTASWPSLLVLGHKYLFHDVGKYEP